MPEQVVDSAHLPMVYKSEAHSILPHANKAPRAINGVQDPVEALRAALRVAAVYERQHLLLRQTVGPRTGLCADDLIHQRCNPGCKPLALL